MKLGLGTVQFGMDYGVSNKKGRPSEKEIEKILEMASQKGVRTLDTSSQYGDSERILGRLLPANHNFEVVLKGLTADIEGSFMRSLENLRLSRAYAYLIHDPESLSRHGSTKIFGKMQFLKQRGLVKKIGVSVYNAAQIDLALELSPIDIVQLPINLLDQRLIKSGHLDKLKKLGVEIHGRSVFLQGLLVMDPDNLPKIFDSVRDHLKKLNSEVRSKNLTMLQAALGFALNVSQLDRVIVGVNHLSEFPEVLNVSALELNTQQKLSEMARWNEENIVNPSKWEESCH